MKTLLVVRHAKSSWDDLSLTDFDRPLNERGLKDAPKMAARLLEQKVKIDVFVSSPASRAKATALLFMKEYGSKPGQLLLFPELYDAPADSFYDAITRFDSSFDNIAVYSHNPGITAFANSLTKHTVDDLPTCSIFAVKCAISNWSDFKNTPKDFWFFDYPKKG